MRRLRRAVAVLCGLALGVLTFVTVTAVWAGTEAEQDVIRGTKGADTLIGTDKADRIYGFSGKDWLRGLGGDDTLVGGNGQDTISGGPGRDRILARDGMRDRIFCGLGVDTVFGDALDKIHADCERKFVPTSDQPPSPPGTRNCSVTDYKRWTWEQCKAGRTITVVNKPWHCDRPLESYGPLPIKVVSISTQAWLDAGAVTLNAGCTGSPGTDINLIVDIRGEGPHSPYGSGIDAFKTRVNPRDIRLTGSIQCGKREPEAHQDAIQIQGGTNITFVNVEAGGDYDKGMSTCQSAGGGPFYSLNRITNVDVLGGKYIGCNKALNGGAPSEDVDIVGAKFRSGRTDGTDPNCQNFFSARPCLNTSGMRLEGITCERWLGGRWVAVPPG